MKTISIPEFDYVNSDDKNHDLIFINDNVNSIKSGVNLGLALIEILLHPRTLLVMITIVAPKINLLMTGFLNNFSADNVETIEFEILENSLMITSELSSDRS